MLQYLLNTIILQLFFLILYDVFHKKDTFFNWNRIYLIFTPLLSLVLPLIKIKALNTPTAQVYIQKIEHIVTASAENISFLNTAQVAQEDTNWWLILYITGIGISLLLLILKLHKLHIITNISFKTTSLNKKVVILNNTYQAFSFWNTIFLGDLLNDKEKEQIISHEIVHVNQKHSLDHLWFEILKIALWWNPLIYIYQSKVTLLHEYIADAIAINTVGKKNYLQQLLNTTFQTEEIVFVNQFFNQSLIKKRILMLQKNNSKSIAKFKYLLLIPVIAGVLTYTSCSEDASQTTTNEDYVSVEEAKKMAEQAALDAVENFKQGKDASELPLAEASSAEAESNCLNQNAVYETKLDNYLKLEIGNNTEVIVEIKSIETSKIVRTVHLLRNQKYRIKNIPEGKYRLDVTYGEDYTEENVDGKCKGFFKIDKMHEEGEDVLDFSTIRTEEGLNIPSYTMVLDLVNEHEH